MPVLSRACPPARKEVEVTSQTPSIRVCRRAAAKEATTLKEHTSLTCFANASFSDTRADATAGRLIRPA